MQLERPIDNIHVDEDGSIYATTLTKVLAFMEAGKDGGVEKNSAVEIFRISNDTTKGHGYKADLVFADDGEIVSSSTTAAPYRGKLILTGTLGSSRIGKG